MKILILRVSAIGDVIHSFPAIFLIKKIIPNAEISWVVQKKAAHLLIDQPFLQNVFVLPDKFLNRQNWKTTAKIVKEIKQTKWDLILDFQGILKTSIIISLLKGLKIGFDKKNARARITTYFTHQHITPNYTNIIQKNLALVSGALQKINKNYTSSPTINELQKDFHLNYSDNTKNLVNKWLDENKVEKLLLLSPNTTWPSKHWPEQNWAKLLDLIHNNNSNNDSKFSVALLGKDFGQQGQFLSNYISEKKLNILNIPKWDLLTTGYLISKSNLLVAPDTGILHLGDYLNTNTIAIFGPTLAKRHGPFLKTQNIKNAIQIECPHFYQKTHGAKTQNPSINNNCMYRLTPMILFEKIIKIMYKY